VLVLRLENVIGPVFCITFDLVVFAVLNLTEYLLIQSFRACWKTGCSSKACRRERTSGKRALGVGRTATKRRRRSQKTTRGKWNLFV